VIIEVAPQGSRRGPPPTASLVVGRRRCSRIRTGIRRVEAQSTTRAAGAAPPAGRERFNKHTLAAGRCGDHQLDMAHHALLRHGLTPAVARPAQGTRPGSWRGPGLLAPSPAGLQGRYPREWIGGGPRSLPIRLAQVPLRRG